MGLILSKNGWRGGLDIRPLFSARARACSYGWFERWWRSSQRGSTCSYHHLDWPVGLSHSTKTVSQCLFLFSLKQAVCSSSETTWVIYSRTALLFTLNYLSSGSFCAPRCQSRARTPDQVGLTGVGSDYSSVEGWANALHRRRGSNRSCSVHANVQESFFTLCVFLGFYNELKV